MVMMAEPLSQCLEAIRADHGVTAGPPLPVVLFSPVGQQLDHAGVVSWSASAGAVLLCGRYEGLDQRFIDRYVTHQISLGDFVLSGGEIAAMALLDAVARLQPGVLNDEGSHQFDSFNPALDGLLDCPHYTRPEAWTDTSVPAVLMSGNHALIKRWRREQSLSLTWSRRPDVLAKARLDGRLTPRDEAFLDGLTQDSPAHD
jgi:tRNA (guanine37-N1)-methyltransferase